MNIVTRHKITNVVRDLRDQKQYLRGYWSETRMAKARCLR